MKLNSRCLLPLLLYYLSCHTGNTYSEKQVNVDIRGLLARMLCMQYSLEGNLSKTPPKPHKYPLYKGFNAPCRIIHRRICSGSADCQKFSSSRKRPCDEEANLSRGEFGNYFEGDINSPQQRAGDSNKSLRWPNRTKIGDDGGVVSPIIPFEFDPDLETTWKITIDKAISYIESCTCIRFEVKQPVHNDWVYITEKDDGCFVSHIGRTSGQLTLNVERTCEFGNVVHELLHAIGFWHEQSRPDRDQYVTILEENIQAGLEGNFGKISTSMWESFGEKYDYSSIMHYPRNAFAKPGLITIDVKDPSVYIGQRDGSAGVTLFRSTVCMDARIKFLQNVQLIIEK